jgi:hypothetical protein
MPSLPASTRGVLISEPRRSAFLIILVCVCSLSATAQRERYIGIKGGNNYSRLATSDPSVYSNSNIGYHFGLQFMWRYPKSAIQTEVIASNHRISFDYPVYGVRTNSFWYVNVPVLYKRYLLKRGLNAQGGVQPGVMVGGSAVKSYSPSGASPPVMGEPTLKSNFLVSGVFGLGWDFDFGGSLDVRYNLGLTDSYYESSSWTIRNRVVQVSVGYRIKRR